MTDREKIIEAMARGMFARITGATYWPKTEASSFGSEWNIRQICIADATAALAALEAAGWMVTKGWQPIETAPTDGKVFLVCDIRTLEGDLTAVYWSDSSDGYTLQEPTGDAYHPRSFTHWAPKPPLPASLTAGGENAEG